MSTSVSRFERFTPRSNAERYPETQRHLAGVRRALQSHDFEGAKRWAYQAMVSGGATTDPGTVNGIQVAGYGPRAIFGEMLADRDRLVLRDALTRPTDTFEQADDAMQAAKALVQELGPRESHGLRAALEADQRAVFSLIAAMSSTSDDVRRTRAEAALPPPNTERTSGSPPTLREQVLSARPKGAADYGSAAARVAVLRELVGLGLLDREQASRLELLPTTAFRYALDRIDQGAGSRRRPPTPAELAELLEHAKRFATVAATQRTGAFVLGRGTDELRVQVVGTLASDFLTSTDWSAFQKDLAAILESDEGRGVRKVVLEVPPVRGGAGVPAAAAAVLDRSPPPLRNSIDWTYSGKYEPRLTLVRSAVQPR